MLLVFGQTSGASSQGAQIPDMEDMCSLCSPLPTPTLVTTFPMKMERKKAREELDIVNVIEWRDANDRWFVLVRRPEGGKFASPRAFSDTFL